MTPTPEFEPGHPTRNQATWQRRLEKIPPLFQDNDLRRFTARSQDFIRNLRPESLVQSFRDGTGLVIAGPVGTNKTRLACHLAMATMAETWTTVGFLSAANIRARALADWGNAAGIIDTASKPGILILDDLGKGSPTATVDEIVFTILDQRTSWGRQTIVTTNYDPETLKTRFKETETATAIMRRLLEFNEPFQP